MTKRMAINAPAGLAILLAIVTGMALLRPMQLQAQTTYGSIVGTVTDASGAAVPGATISVSNLGTGETRATKSDGAGNFSVVDLVPANYKVDVQKANFKRFERQPVTVAVGATVRTDAALQVGAATETVEVTTQAPLLQTDSGTLSTQVQGEAVTEMPLNGRNTMNLLALAAGVIPQGSTQGGTAINQGYMQKTNEAGWNNYQISGTLAGESSVYLDGAPNSILRQNAVALVMTQDAVQEFNVASNNMTADYGRNGGAVVSMASKGGTNSFHGSVYEYIRNSFFNSNEFFNKQAEAAEAGAGVKDPITGNLISNKPLQWNQDQYGVVFGGPVKKDKAFFHFTWEHLWVDAAGNHTGQVVPTVNQQNGLIPEIWNHGQLSSFVDYGAKVFPGGSYTANGATYNPAAVTGLSTCNFQHTVPGTASSPGYYTITNLWTAGCGDPMAKIIRGYYPPPTPGYSYQGNNFYYAPPVVDAQNQYNARFDYVLSSKQRLFARYTWWHLQDTGQAGLGNYGGWKTGGGAERSTSEQAVLGDTYTFSPKTVLDLRLSYLRMIAYDSYPASYGTSTSLFPGTYYPLIANQMQEHVLPSAGIGSPATYNIANGPQPMLDLSFYNTYAITPSLVTIWGKHTFKLGAELRLMQFTNFGTGPSINSGSFSFGGTSTGDPWTDFLLGYVQYSTGRGGSGISLGEAVTNYSYYQAYYITDTWQMTRRLTWTLGLRWELPGGVTAKHGLNTVLLPSYQWTYTGAGGVQVPVTGAYGLLDSPLYTSGSSINIKHDLFGPRVGFAYRLSSSMAVRGGYGLAYPAIDSGGAATGVGSGIVLQNTYCGSNFSTGGPGGVTYPNFAQLMYNCLGSTTVGNTTYTPSLTEPVGRAYNGGPLVAYLNGGYPGGRLSGPIPQERASYVQQWNLAVSRQMKGDMMVEVGYAGAKGTFLRALGTNFNELPDSQWLQWDSTHTVNLLGGYPGGSYQNSPDYIKYMSHSAAATGTVNAATSLTCGQFGQAIGNGNITEAQCSLPYPVYGNVSNSIAYNGSSIYHGLQVKGEKRFRSGGMIMANYTWSKIIGDTDSTVGNYLENAAGGAVGPGSPGGAGAIQDYNNMKAERSVMTYDVPQRAVISYVVGLPFGKGQRWGKDATGVVGHVISGWGLNGITTFQKGFHLALGNSADNNANDLTTYNNDNSTFGLGTIRPNVVSGCNKKGGLTGSYASRVIAHTPQLNTSCWTQPVYLTPGNEPRVDSNVFAQGIDNFDLSFLKATAITERTNVQFRAEFFNLFNRIQFGPPEAQVGQMTNNVAQFGLIEVTANQPRLVQFSVRINF